MLIIGTPKLLKNTREGELHMKRMTNMLTDMDVRNAKPNPQKVRKLFDGQGLYLRISDYVAIYSTATKRFLSTTV